MIKVFRIQSIYYLGSSLFFCSWEGLVAASRKSKKFWIWLAVEPLVVLVVAGWGVALAKVATTSIDPNRLAKVKRGDVARSVVATGKIQPITQVEVKSKASGIVEKLLCGHQ